MIKGGTRSQMNIQLHHVLSDVAGVTGMKIVCSIIAGERDLKVLSHYREGRCRAPVEVVEKSLQGHYRLEHVFALQQAVEWYNPYYGKSDVCDEAIEELLKTFGSEGDVETQPVPAEKR